MRAVFVGVRGTAVMVALLTVVVRLVAVAKELAIAAVFGVGAEVDGLVLAGALPVFLVGVVAGSIPAALIPVMSRLQATDRLEQRSALIALLAGRVLLVLCGLSVVLAAAAPILAGALAPGSVAILGNEATWLFILMAPNLLLNGYAAFWCGVLNGMGRYAVPAIAPMVTPLMMLLAIALSGPTARIDVVVVGALAGGIVEVGVLSFYAARRGLRCIPTLQGRGNEASEVAAQYRPMLVGSTLMSSTVLVDQVMAARVAEGAVSVLNYASKVPLLIVGLLGTALATAALPAFSRLAVAGAMVELRREGFRLARATLAGTLAVTVGLWILSEPIVRILYQRGQFDAAATNFVAYVQCFAALQIPFYCVSLIAGRMLSAMQMNTALMWGAALSVALNVVLNLWLGRLMGVAGIALSTALVYLVSTVLLWAIALRAMGVRNDS